MTCISARQRVWYRTTVGVRSQREKSDRVCPRQVDEVRVLRGGNTPSLPGADLGESASLVDSLFGFIFDETIRVAFKGLGNPFDDRITSLFARRIVLNRYRLVRAGMVIDPRFLGHGCYREQRNLAAAAVVLAFKGGHHG